MKHRSARGLRRGILGVAAAAALLVGCASGTATAHGWAPPVAAPNGLLLVQSAVGKLAAVKPDGTRVAEYELKGPATTDFIGRTKQEPAAPIYATPLIQGDAVYVASYKGRVARLKLDATSLTPAWDVELNEHVVATPILRGNRLYVSAENGHLLVLDAASGSLVSSSRPTAGRVWGAPGAREDRLFIGTLDSSELLAVNADSGAVQWRQGVAGATAADLVADNDQLLVASFDRTLHGLDIASGAEKWRLEGDGWFVGRPLVANGTIYAATMRGSVYALDRGGKLLWKFTRTGLEFRATPILAGKSLIVADRDGDVIALDAATGAEQWTRPTEVCAGKPECIDADGLLLDSAIFYVTADRHLLRVDPAGGTLQAFTIQSGDGK